MCSFFFLISLFDSVPRRCNDREKTEMRKEEGERSRFGPGPTNRFVRKLSYVLHRIYETFIHLVVASCIGSFLHPAREYDRNLLEMIFVVTLYYFYIITVL